MMFAGLQSGRSPVICGVPQRSVLRPILFLLFAVDIIIKARRHGLGDNPYASDTQMYLHTAAFSLARQSANLKSTAGWRLTAWSWKGIKPSSCVLVSVSWLIVNWRLRHTSGRCFYQLRQLRTIRHRLAMVTTKALVHAFITSRLNYHNSVLSGVAAVCLRQL
jgi:hypothetical protein